MSGSEPFPLLNTANDQLHQRHQVTSSPSVSNTTATQDAINNARKRRKSSALGGDIRGDTGAPALASSRASLELTDNHSNVSVCLCSVQPPLFCIALRCVVVLFFNFN